MHRFRLPLVLAVTVLTILGCDGAGIPNSSTPLSPSPNIAGAWFGEFAAIGCLDNTIQVTLTQELGDELSVYGRFQVDACDALPELQLLGRLTCAGDDICEMSVDVYAWDFIAAMSGSASETAIELGDKSSGTYLHLHR